MASPVRISSHSRAAGAASWVLLVAAMMWAGCDEVLSGDGDPAFGTVQVSVEVSGEYDDSARYEMSVGERRIEGMLRDTVVTILDVPSGDLTVRLNPSPSRCVVEGEVSRRIIVRAEETIEVIFSVGCDPSVPRVALPSVEDWTDRGVVIRPGSNGSWDEGIWGAFNLASVRKIGDALYMYYVGADGERSFDGGPRHRALGYATSEDGIHWQKAGAGAGNPLITHRPNDGEEEGIFSGASWRVDGTSYLFVGVMVGTGGSVHANTDLYVSTDGVRWSLEASAVTDHRRDPGNDEQFSFAAYEHEGTWNLFYSAKGGVADWTLTHAQGPSPEQMRTFTTLRTLANFDAKAGGEVIKQSANTYLLPVSDTWDVRLYAFDPERPTELHRAASWPREAFDAGMKEWVLHLDRELGTWFLYYTTTDRDGIHLATAPVREDS